MRFHETAMGLAFKQREFDLLGRNTQIEPRETLADRNIFGTIEKDLPHDLLRPCRTRLAIGRDHDIAIAEFELVPHGGIEMIAFHLAQLFRPRDCPLRHDRPLLRGRAFITQTVCPRGHRRRLN